MTRINTSFKKEAELSRNTKPVFDRSGDGDGVFRARTQGGFIFHRTARDNRRGTPVPFGEPPADLEARRAAAAAGNPGVERSRYGPRRALEMGQ
jgi:hypothetical protein